MFTWVLQGSPRLKCLLPTTLAGGAESIEACCTPPADGFLMGGRPLLLAPDKCRYPLPPPTSLPPLISPAKAKNKALSNDYRWMNSRK